ncbi:hypothetical protein [Fructilactobacillus sanfranciscensis]|uniref:hypothetical protein n=1 Tax=Fructilactobacillus sanfranciscensis TaxID=1625 RepID=UPI0013D3164E|nr:hypothetical protein [Fructilactobacillus sanfranciscensis]
MKPKAEIKNLKFLNTPKQGSEQNYSLLKENPVENKVKEPKKQKKKWWLFKK